MDQVVGGVDPLERPLEALAVEDVAAHHLDLGVDLGTEVLRAPGEAAHPVAGGP